MIRGTPLISLISVILNEQDPPNGSSSDAKTPTAPAPSKTPPNFHKLAPSPSGIDARRFAEKPLLDLAAEGSPAPDYLGQELDRQLAVRGITEDLQRSYPRAKEQLHEAVERLATWRKARLDGNQEAWLFFVGKRKDKYADENREDLRTLMDLYELRLKFQRGAIPFFLEDAASDWDHLQKTLQATDKLAQRWKKAKVALPFDPASLQAELINGYKHLATLAYRQHRQEAFTLPKSALVTHNLPTYRQIEEIPRHQEYFARLIQDQVLHRLRRFDRKLDLSFSEKGSEELKALTTRLEALARRMLQPTHELYWERLDFRSTRSLEVALRSALANDPALRQAVSRYTLTQLEGASLHHFSASPDLQPSPKTEGQASQLKADILLALQNDLSGTPPRRPETGALEYEQLSRRVAMPTTDQTLYWKWQGFSELGVQKSYPRDSGSRSLTTTRTQRLERLDSKQLLETINILRLRQKPTRDMKEMLSDLGLPRDASLEEVFAKLEELRKSGRLPSEYESEYQAINSQLEMDAIFNARVAEVPGLATRLSYLRESERGGDLFREIYITLVRERHYSTAALLMGNPRTRFLIEDNRVTNKRPFEREKERKRKGMFEFFRRGK